MNCPVRDGNESEIVIGYAAGTLTADEQAAFERHMAGCAECRAVAEAQQQAWTALDEYRAPAVSGDFDQKLYARIAREERLPWWKREWNMLAHRAVAFSWKPAIPVSLACAALCGAFLLRNGADNPAPAPRVPAAVVAVQQGGQKVDINQVESALDDMDMLNQLGGDAPAQGGVRTGS